MTRPQRIAFLVILGISLAACAAQVVDAGEDEPALVEEIAGTELHRITLSEHAVERLDVRLAPVRERLIDGERRLTVPYGAILWDARGAGWTYTSPEDRIYVRAPVTLDRVAGDEAILLHGPEPGTKVVEVGAAELWGVENGVGGGH